MKIQFLTAAGGAIRCRRCQATSKRTSSQCGAPAMRDKNVCRVHGGNSTGPRTQAGRQAFVESKTTVGTESREQRRMYRAKLKELREFEKLIKKQGL